MRYVTVSTQRIDSRYIPPASVAATLSYHCNGGLMGRHGQAVAESTISRSNSVGKVFLTEKPDFNSVHVPNDGSAGWGRSSGGFQPTSNIQSRDSSSRDSCLTLINRFTKCNPYAVSRAEIQLFSVLNVFTFFLFLLGVIIISNLVPDGL